MPIFQILILAMIQGAAELLPVSSSAHVIVAEKLLGLDPTSPQMTFLLVMLHTGTMFAVLIHFWKRWAVLFAAREFSLRGLPFLKNVITATAVTGVVGLALKKLIEKLFLGNAQGSGEIEELFGMLPLIAGALLAVGILILVSAAQDIQGAQENNTPRAPLNRARSVIIGLVQGLCLPFRGFSRSGSTISAGLMGGLSRVAAEEFSFALAVALTPPVIALELHRLLKARADLALNELLFPGLIGMAFSLLSGLVALKLLSAWLERGRWNYFGYYCIAASLTVFALAWRGI